VSADGACVAALGEARLALSLRGGQLYVLTLLSDSVRTVRSFHLDRAAASVLTSCVRSLLALLTDIAVSCGVRDKIKEYYLSFSSMDVVKGD
jgi:hypothetical protein